MKKLLIITEHFIQLLKDILQMDLSWFLLEFDLLSVDLNSSPTSQKH